MAQSNPSRPLLVFYLLVSYVVLQFGWWGWHIIDLNSEIYGLRLEITGMQMAETLELAAKKSELDHKLTTRVWMVLGEGTVFMLLLALGVAKVRQSFKREQAATRQQSDFLAAVTHELKTPLAGTRLLLETLEKRELEPEKRKELITKAIAQTDRLTALVENILLATSIQNRGYQADRQPGNLSDTMRNMQQEVRDMYVFSGNIVWKIQNDVEFRFDRNAIESIVLNLVENAIKYAPDSKTIVVELQQSKEAVSISVADEGLGIPADERNAIFEQFYRIGNEHTRSAKGTGLGLYIVKELAAAHDGTVSVHDNQPEGSIFAVRFAPSHTAKTD